MTQLGTAPRGLEVDQDLRFERRQMRVAWAATAGFVLLVVLGLLGLTGRGPLSDSTAQSASGELSVAYERFVRSGLESELEVRLSAGGSGVAVAVDRTYLDALDLESVTPQPDSETTTADRVLFRYEGRSPSTVVFSVTPRKIGVRSAGVSVGDARASFRQLVYP